MRHQPRAAGPGCCGSRVEDHHGCDDFRVRLGIIRVIVGYGPEHTSRNSRAELRSTDDGYKETWRHSHNSQESLTSSQHTGSAAQLKATYLTYLSFSPCFHYAREGWATAREIGRCVLKLLAMTRQQRPALCRPGTSASEYATAVPAAGAAGNLAPVSRAASPRAQRPQRPFRG